MASTYIWFVCGHPERNIFLLRFLEEASYDRSSEAPLRPHYPSRSSLLHYLDSSAAASASYYNICRGTTAPAAASPSSSSSSNQHHCQQQELELRHKVSGLRKQTGAVAGRDSLSRPSANFGTSMEMTSYGVGAQSDYVHRRAPNLYHPLQYHSQQQHHQPPQGYQHHQQESYPLMDQVSEWREGSKQPRHRVSCLDFDPDIILCVAVQQRQPRRQSDHRGHLPDRRPGPQLHVLGRVCLLLCLFGGRLSGSARLRHALSELGLLGGAAAAVFLFIRASVSGTVHAEAPRRPSAPSPRASAKVSAYVLTSE